MRSPARPRVSCRFGAPVNGVLAVCTLAIGVLLAAAAPPANAQTLAELESAARSNAAAVRIAREDEQVQQHRLDATEAQRGGRFTAGAGLADTREPVTDTLVRDYRRGGVQVGVRLPLLESAQTLERAQTDARGALEASRLRARQAELDVQRAVRIGYIDHLRSAERAALAEALFALDEKAAPLLAARTRQSMLLEAERRDLQTIFETARRDAARMVLQRDEALRRLRRLSAAPQALPARDPPRWNLGCVVAAPLLASADQRPAVALAAIELATREALAGQLQWSGVDAGVSLTQSLTQDIGGPSGRSTGVSIDVSVPFGWRALRDARLAEAQSAVRRARLELDAAREADVAAVDQALRELKVRESDRSAALQRLDAALENSRVAERRALTLDGDVIERALRARQAVYGAALDLSEALQRYERAQAEVLVYAPACEAAAAEIEPASWRELSTALAAPLVAQPAAGTAALAALAPHRTAGLGWFAWQAAPWLATPAEQLAALPSGSDRLLLGLDAQQLRALAEPAGEAGLRSLLTRAHERGVRVELLLGDPGWVTRAGRERLVALLRPIAALPFDGINLDLERSQLAPRLRNDRRAWADGVIETIAAVRPLVRWPIALTTHDRDLIDAKFNRRLQAAGASELVAMIYVADRDRAATRVLAVMRAAPGLRVSVAQSVERELAPASSLHTLGRAKALSRSAELARAIADQGAAEARFAGVVLQSFEEFRRAPP